MTTPIRGPHQSIMARCYAVAIQVNLLENWALVGLCDRRDATDGDRAHRDAYPTRGYRHRKLPTASALIPRTLLTAESDSTNATRSYPPDSTDKANSLNQITF